MKKIIAAGLMLASMNSFSQSYLVLSNGITLTTDTSGFLHDFGNFRLPYQVTINGGQFLVEDGKLNTVDSQGYMYEKPLKVKKIKGNGLNYFIDKLGKLVTVAENGFYFEFKVPELSRRLKKFGGNYFILKATSKKKRHEIYTINSSGNYFKIEVEGLNTEDIKTHGGTFFQTKDGVVYTVSKDGFVYGKPEIKVGAIKTFGGNYFTDTNNVFYTVSEDGMLKVPTLPSSLNVSEIEKRGANYLLTSKSAIFAVDKAGNVFERNVEHDLSNTKIISY